MFYVCRMIFERKELLSVPWSSLDQTAVLLALVLSQVISYLLLPSALQLLHPAGLNLSLLSSNFITLAAATSILMYKVGLSSLSPGPPDLWTLSKISLSFFYLAMAIPDFTPLGLRQ